MTASSEFEDQLGPDDLERLFAKIHLINSDIERLRDGIAFYESTGIYLMPGVDPSPQESSTGRDSFGRWLWQHVIVPVVGFLIAAAALLGAAMIAKNDKAANSPSCIDVYAKVQTIRVSNPGFVLPDDDPDQRRCKVNTYLPPRVSEPLPAPSAEPGLPPAPPR